MDIFVESVAGIFFVQEYVEHNAAPDSDSQAYDVYERREFMPKQITDSQFEIAFQHKILLMCFLFILRYEFKFKMVPSSSLILVSRMSRRI
jgi:hypothetical protein